MGDRDLTPTVIRMPSDLHAAVKAQAAREERSMAQLIRYALRRYLAANPPPPPTDGGTTEAAPDHAGRDVTRADLGPTQREEMGRG